MRAVKRWRYYCDHCKKAGGLRSAMEKHEKACTLNPRRECGICAVVDGSLGTPVQAMLEMLPDPAKFVIHHPAEPGEFGYEAHDTTDDESLRDAVHAMLPQLRELTSDCPACILAALRQRGIPVPLVTDFDFTKEFASAQGRMNDHRAEQEGRYY